MKNADKLAISPWREIVVTDDKAILSYAGGAVVFEGEASTVLLPELLPLLDGSRSGTEITTLFDEAIHPAVNNAIELLDDHELLYSPPSDPTLKSEQQATVNSIVELMAETMTADEVTRVLRQKTIVVVGDNPRSALLCDLLQRAPLAAVVSAPEKEALTAISTHQPQFIIVAPNRAESRALSDVNSYSLKTQTTWMPILPSDGVSAVVGPVFLPGQTGCYQCFRIRKRSVLDHNDIQGEFDRALDDGRGIPNMGDWDNPGNNAILAGQGASIALWGLMPPEKAIFPFFGRALTLSWSIEGYKAKQHRLLKVPRCPTCGRTRRTGLPQPWHGRNEYSQ